MLKLFFGLTLFDVMDAMTGNSYGSPYATTATGYAAPAATSSYGTPSTGYDAHTSYSARTSFYDEEDVSSILVKFISTVINFKGHNERV